MPGGEEQRYLRWSTARAGSVLAVALAIIGVLAEGGYWALAHGVPLEAVPTRWAYKLGKALPLPKLVPIPAGQFEMGEVGDWSAEPVHPVTVARPFYIG